MSVKPIRTAMALSMLVPYSQTAQSADTIFLAGKLLTQLRPHVATIFQDIG